MFTWNRAEVLVTLSYDYYMQVRYLLKQQQITNQSRRVVIDAPAQAASSNGSIINVGVAISRHLLF